MILRCLYIVLIGHFVFSVNKVHAQEEGIASYYHDKFHGRMTSSGEIHSNSTLVAAHRTIPFGTYVKVTNLSNSKSVIVRITDRGPHYKRRVMDLSYAAAEALDFVDKGITRVRLEVVPTPYEFSFPELLPPPPIVVPTEPSQVKIPLRLEIK